MTGGAPDAQSDLERTIDIHAFVHQSEIDPIYYESTYYLAPDRGAAKAYGLLLDAMQRSGKVGLSTFVLRTREYLCSLRPLENALALTTMNHADDIVSPESLGLPSRGEPSSERELAMARQLVESLSARFEPEKYPARKSAAAPSGPPERGERRHRAEAARAAPARRRSRKREDS